MTQSYYYLHADSFLYHSAVFPSVKPVCMHVIVYADTVLSGKSICLKPDSTAGLNSTLKLGS